MLIVGVDPGLADSGVGVVKQDGPSITSLEHCCISTKASMLFPERLVMIHDAFAEILDRVKPDACAVEAIFFAKNAKSAFQVGHGRAVFILAAAQRGIPVFEYTPPQIKKALVGKGRADKSQVQYMTKMILGMQEIPKPDHAADALAVAVCHANSIKFLSVTGLANQVYSRKQK